MKNNTQIVKRNYFIPLLLLFFVTTFGQNAIVGSGFSSGWGGSCPNTGILNFKSFAHIISGTYGVTTTANGTGDQFFRFGVDWGGTTAQLAITPGSDVSVAPNTTYSLNTACTTSGSIKYNVPNASYNYVFKTLNAGANPTGTFVFFEVQGAVRTVATVTQWPLSASVTECHSTKITATLDGALASGQQVYMRYTTDNYATSTVVKLSGSGTTYAGTIPSSFNTSGASVSYYVFTSGDTGVALDGSNTDLYTINLNNNGGPNYSYTVLAGVQTTSIPDPNFEQVLIDLNLDCVKDGKVFTNNISDVTFLDIRGKGITDLTGIEAFASLNFFYCGDNLLTSLDVSGLTNLWELVASNNSISSLDVHSSPHLYYLACDNNSLTSLNISGLTKLHVLDVSVNQLGGTLDVSGNPDLEYLYCNDNSLISLDVSGLTKILELVTSNNNISSLDVSASTDLSYLDCDKNKFTSINVTGLVKLVSFYCSDNELTSIDVRGLTVLKDFECTGNSGLKCIQVDDVAAANTKTITVGPDPDPDGKGPFLWAKDTGAIYSNCSLITTWTSALGGSWDNGVPTTGTYAAIIAADYNQPANIAACTLTVKNNATVYILSGFNVTLSSSLTVEAGSSFTLNNNANLVQTANVTNTGAIAVNLDSNALSRLDYTMWSSPVKAQNLLDFSPETIASRFYVYNPSTNLYGSITPGDHNFVPGFGYLIRMPNTALSAPSTQIFEGVFTGEPNNGSLTFATTSGLYYAVGNPYPSTIDANAFLTGNSTDGTLYFWRKTNGEANTPGSSATGTAYATWTTMGSAASDVAPNNIAPDGTIALGQGFIVKSTGASLSFTNAMRTANNSAQFFKTKQLAGKSRVWLNLTNTTGAFSQALVGYVDGATVGVDSGIDGKYINDSAIALTSNINNEEYTIQGRPAFDASDIVALNFKTDVAGDYSISIDHVDGVFATGQDIYLVDGKTGAETNLKNASYNFTATAGVDNARFSLKYQKTLKVADSSMNDNTVIVYTNKGILYVNSSAKAISSIKVYDVQGRLLEERNNVKANTATVTNLKAFNQILIVQVRGEDNSEVTKKAAN